MILVIDDCPRRIEAFRRALGKIIVAMDYTAAAFHLSHYGRDLTAVYLDHDGVEGELLAINMARLGIAQQAKVYIHSSNYAGAIKMRGALKDTHDVELVDWREVTGCGEAT
jgi:hypothetical protein